MIDDRKDGKIEKRRKDWTGVLKLRSWSLLWSQVMDRAEVWEGTTRRVGFGGFSRGIVWWYEM